MSESWFDLHPIACCSPTAAVPQDGSTCKKDLNFCCFSRKSCSWTNREKGLDLADGRRIKNRGAWLQHGSNNQIYLRQVMLGYLVEKNYPFSKHLSLEAFYREGAGRHPLRRPLLLARCGVGNRTGAWAWDRRTTWLRSSSSSGGSCRCIGMLLSSDDWPARGRGVWVQPYKIAGYRSAISHIGPVWDDSNSGQSSSTPKL